MELNDYYVLRELMDYYKQEIDRAETLRDSFPFEIDGKGCPILSTDNVAKALILIERDPANKKYLDEKNENTALFFIKKLTKGTASESEYKELLASIVKRIDIENSTHLSADYVGREQMAERIFNFANTAEELLAKLRDFEKGVELIGELSKPTATSTGRGRRNFSFATKFCHFVALYTFNEKERHQYPIYDSAMRKALLAFSQEEAEVLLKKIESSDKDNIDYKKIYKDYISIINKVVGNSQISMHGFDQLMWYFYKDHE